MSPPVILITRSSPGPRLHLAHLRRRDIFADNLPAEIHKRLVNVGAAARACFVIGRIAPRLGDGEGTGPRHRSVFLQVRFVTDNHERNTRVIFYPHDLISELVQFGERGEGCDAEDEKKALAGFHIQLPATVVRGMLWLLRGGIWEVEVGRNRGVWRGKFALYLIAAGMILLLG